MYHLTRRHKTLLFPFVILVQTSSRSGHEIKAIETDGTLTRRIQDL